MPLETHEDLLELPVKQLGHSSQIQQGSRIDVLKSSSTFYHLIASMREVFPEDFSLMALIFRDTYFHIVFAVSLTGAIS